MPLRPWRLSNTLSSFNSLSSKLLENFAWNIKMFSSFARGKLFACLFYFECELLEGRAGRMLIGFLPPTWLTSGWHSKKRSGEQTNMEPKSIYDSHETFMMESAASLCFQDFVLRRPQNEISCTGENIHCSLQRVRDTPHTQVLLKCFYEPPWGLHIPLYGACCYQQCFEKSHLLTCLYSSYVHACI